MLLLSALGTWYIFKVELFGLEHDMQFYFLCPLVAAVGSDNFFFTSFLAKHA